jgi:hypothetical protein
MLVSYSLGNLPDGDYTAGTISPFGETKAVRFDGVKFVVDFEDSPVINGIKFKSFKLYGSHWLVSDEPVTEEGVLCTFTDYLWFWTPRNIQRCLNLYSSHICLEGNCYSNLLERIPVLVP